MSSSRSVTSRCSNISRRPPPEIFIQPSSNNNGISVPSSSSTSLYTSSSYSTPVLTEQYDLNFRNGRVSFHTDHFLRLFDISDEPRERIFLEDDLRATYLTSSIMMERSKSRFPWKIHISIMQTYLLARLQRPND